MSSIHPKLTEHSIEHTPRAMIAMVLVSSVYVWIFIRFIPLSILSTWFVFQILIALYRLYNAKMLKKCLELQDDTQREKHETYFLFSNILQALSWTAASIYSLVYAHPPYELVNFVMIIGIITAAALSMSSLYKAYLVFFFFMIIPQIMIMIYCGEHHHYALVALTIIFIPAIMLLSKAIYTNQLSIIESHDELQKSVEELHKLSITDTLTNIYNRRYFFEVAQNLILIAQREKKLLSILMLDIDFFKSVNDSFGHHAGDFILVSAVQAIQKLVRESDLFARVGGEEFAILLSDTTMDGAKITAEKIRANIEDKEFIYHDIKIKVTISIGVSQLDEKNNSIEMLYKQADKQLYTAKESGRNRVC